MAFDATMTEVEMDAEAQQMIQKLRDGNHEFEPDLEVDGMTPSILSRLINLFSRG